ncbi:MAG: hypothetical protein AB7L92_07600 [Alphaproteobacteria bacterium]
MSEDTQGDILRKYMRAAQPTAEELAARSEAMRNMSGLLAGELAARVGVKKERVTEWLRDEQPILYEGEKELSIKPLKEALGLDSDQTFEVNQARKALAEGPVEGKAEQATEAPVQTETAAQSVAGEMTDERSRELRAAAGKALRDLMAATPASAAELRKRSDASQGRRAASVMHVLPIELAARKGVKLKIGDIRLRVGSNERPPTERITRKEADGLVAALAQSVEGGNKLFDSAASHFIDAVEESQPAWDKFEADKVHAREESARRRAERRAERG